MRLPPMKGRPHPLTPRELQVLRLVAAADQCDHRRRAFLSERTIERHLSNIFTKLDLSSGPPPPPGPTSTG